MFDFTRVAPVQVYDGIKDLGDNPFPYALVAIMLVVSTLVFIVSKAVLRPLKIGDCSKAKGEERRSPPRKRESLALHSLLLFGVLYVASLPHAGVVVLSLAHDWYSTVLPELWTTEHYREALGHPLVVPSIQNSLFYASAATLVDLILGVAIAWVIVRSTVRGRAFLDALVMLPLAVPGLVLAFGYLALSQKGETFLFFGSGSRPESYLASGGGLRG